MSDRDAEQIRRAYNRGDPLTATEMAIAEGRTPMSDRDAPGRDEKVRYNERHGLRPDACNCHHGSARFCPVHTQADFDAAKEPEHPGDTARKRRIERFGTSGDMW